jgi:hypothetical protein
MYQTDDTILQYRSQPLNYHKLLLHRLDHLKSMEINGANSRFQTHHLSYIR